MIKVVAPPPPGTGDNGYTGDGRAQRRDFRPMFRPDAVPGIAQGRGHRPGTRRWGAR